MEIKKGLLHHNRNLLESPYSAIVLKFLNCDTLVSFGVDDIFHKLDRGQVDTTYEMFKCGNGLSTAKLNAFSCAVCIKYIITAIYIPENNVRNLITMLLNFSDIFS